MPNNTPGVDAFQANIEAMKQIGSANRERRAKEAAEKTQAHLETMRRRAEEARAERERKRLDGLARRNEHNASLRAERRERLAHDEAVKSVTLRAA